MDNEIKQLIILGAIADERSRIMRELWKLDNMAEIWKDIRYIINPEDKQND